MAAFFKTGDMRGIGFNGRYGSGYHNPFGVPCRRCCINPSILANFNRTSGAGAIPDTEGTQAAAEVWKDEMPEPPAAMQAGPEESGCPADAACEAAAAMEEKPDGDPGSTDEATDDGLQDSDEVSGICETAGMDDGSGEY
ncbi:hypothetical protein SDC9_127594 [bioreactor metagenome]|uniref:Uncharacterized protein n=1 Tax=bioreactor metagenome TaxID=1076179 RepID=A0A645CUE4_9ZZZZ